SSEKVIFEEVEKFKTGIFEEAFRSFKNNGTGASAFDEFCAQQSHWLDNYCLYLALRERYERVNWIDWPAEFRDRDAVALRTAEKELAEKIEKEKFIQFLFYSQWGRLVKAAHEKNIKLIGDVPFYVNHDSADCWANPLFFKLDAEKKPTHVSGVPPDLFSRTGQLWGTPVYDWKELKNHHYEWWIARLRQNLLLFDVVRLDHFRAFSAYWEVGAGERTAIHGTWT
ncbi:4-alpha-glucanotransferase, partial [Longispora fulva]|uniref:4-alpha-glucanotransferase n=2 Tax=Bacteria TaxID=2 RepID=UPI00363A734B